MYTIFQTVNIFNHFQIWYKMIFAQEQLIVCIDKNIFINCALANSCCFKGQQKWLRFCFINKNDMFYKQKTTAMYLIMSLKQNNNIL